MEEVARFLERCYQSIETITKNSQLARSRSVNHMFVDQSQPQSNQPSSSHHTNSTESNKNHYHRNSTNSFDKSHISSTTTASTGTQQQQQQQMNESFTSTSTASTTNSNDAYNAFTDFTWWVWNVRRNDHGGAPVRNGKLNQIIIIFWSDECRSKTNFQCAQHSNKFQRCVCIIVVVVVIVTRHSMKNETDNFVSMPRRGNSFRVSTSGWSAYEWFQLEIKVKEKKNWWENVINAAVRIFRVNAFYL